MSGSKYSIYKVFTEPSHVSRTRLNTIGTISQTLEQFGDVELCPPFYK